MLKFTNAKLKVDTLKLGLEKFAGENATPSPEQLPIVRATLKSKLDRFQGALDVLYQAADTDEDHKIIGSTTVLYTEFAEFIEDLIIKLQVSDKPPKLEDDSSFRMSVLSAKLPTLELEQFDGNRLRFASYWSSFVRRVDSKNIPIGDKFEYLKQSLTKDAGLCIAGLIMDDANYECAKKILQDRYGDPSQQIEAHREAIMMMKCCSSRTSDLSATYFKIEEHLNNLQALKDVSKFEEFLPLIKSKFPADICIRIEESLEESETLTLARFRGKLLRIINIREKNERLSESGSDNNWRQERKSSYHSPQYNKFSSSKSSSTVLSTSVESPSRRKPNTPCVFCSGLHWNDDCDVVKTLDERKRKLVGRCFICLSRYHRAGECELDRPCFHCGVHKRHHRSLCPEYVGKLNAAVNVVGAEVEEKAEGDVNVLVAVVNSNRDTYVPTAQAIVSCQNGRSSVAVKLILDTASQSSFITESLAKRLALKTRNYVKLDLTSFGATIPKSTICPTGELTIRTKGGFIDVSVIVVPHIANQLITDWYYQEISRVKKLYPHILINAPARKGVFDVLIGVDYYYRFVGSKNIDLRNGMFWSETKLGYLLVGKKQLSEAAGLTMYLKAQEKVCVCWPSEVDVGRFWDLETIGLGSGLFDDQSEAVDLFNQSIELVSGRYRVSWPWRYRPPPLPDNYNLSYYRLQSVFKQLKVNKEIVEYSEIFNEQEKTGIIEKVEGRSKNLEHYLPHLAVRRGDHRTTKLRVVFDASSRARKTFKSLNDCLLKGRQLLEDLVLILIRFRMYSVVILADIEKAFLQLELKEEEDKDVARFLWLKKPEEGCTPENVQIYRFKRVAFGVASSPFLLNAVVRHHLGSFVQEFPILARLKQAIYVDNLVLSVQTEELALNVYRSTKEVFNKASMNFREWVTNSKSLEKKFEPRDRPNEISVEENVLGLAWNVCGDYISIKEPNCSIGKCASKRTVLKFVASIFDPFGFLAPTILLGKLFIKELWNRQLGWDEVISEELFKEWQRLGKLMIEGVKLVKVARNLDLGNHVDLEIHCFCDASLQAYHASLYLRTTRPDGSITSSLLFSKNRVAPSNDKILKNLTVPRLELLAVCIGVKLIELVRKIFGDIPAFVWSDSQCALHWIRSDKVLPLFEENRIKLIRGVKNVTFKFIPGEVNPVDCATRKILDNSYLTSFSWWHGPEFLKRTQEFWPSWDFSYHKVEIVDYQPVIDTAINVAGVQVELENPPYKVDIETYSDLNEFLLDSWNECEHTSDDAFELEKVLLDWVKYFQNVYFRNEVLDAKVRAKSKLRLWMDNGVLKCSTRLSNSALSDGATFPILLPRNCRFTLLIIRDVHEKSNHVGAHHTLAMLSHRFYIPRGLAQVTRVLRTCKGCAKACSGPYKLPDMPPLPVERVTRSTPFTHIGLDGLGPVNVKVGPEVRKVWVLVITCLTTRAIYLGVMEGLSAVDFLYVFREFVGRRGCPETVLCDNATAFHSIATVSKNIWWSILSDEGVLNYTFSPTRNIKWRFIPAYSPFAGGVYERMVALVKNCIYRTLFDVKLTLKQFRTFMSEVQGVLNGRPICPLDDCGNYLTPNHFLNVPVVLKGPFVSDSGVELADKSAEAYRLWKKGIRLLDSFWKIWTDRYLIFLSTRRVWRVKQNRIVSKAQPKIGEKVLIGDRCARPRWKAGQIVLLEGSRDGHIRTAIVELSDGTRLRRSIGLLYPYEADVQELDSFERAQEVVESTESRSVGEELVEDEGLEESPEREVENEVGRPAKIRVRRQAVMEESLSEESATPSLSPPGPSSPPLLLSQSSRVMENESQDNLNSNEAEGGKDGTRMLDDGTTVDRIN